MSLKLNGSKIALCGRLVMLPFGSVHGNRLISDFNRTNGDLAQLRQPGDKDVSSYRFTRRRGGSGHHALAPVRP